MTEQRKPSASDRVARRESVFILCDIGRVDGTFIAQGRVRNISPFGMMADIPVALEPGETVIVAFRHVESVYATVSWVKRVQSGLAFHSEVDPQLLRRPLGTARPAPKSHGADNKATYQT